MKTVNSLSGGKTSSYIAVHYPADYDVFALCCIDSHNAGRSIDSKMKQRVNDKLQKYCSHYPEFVATSEDSKILQVMFDLEQMTGREIIGAYTAMRFSDYSELKGIKATDEYISRVSEKTGVKTVIPMHHFIKDILLRRNGILPPPVSNQKMNKQLKVLGKASGLTNKVEITTSKVNRKERKSFEMWELLTTHSARRSGCTNMYLAGLEVADIMSFSGHTTEKSFKKYIKATSQQVAEKNKDHSFFNKKSPSNE